MTIFFLLIGLELEEIYDGELSNIKDLLPFLLP
jgi:Na+/H+ antiporter NhaA